MGEEERTEVRGQRSEDKKKRFTAKAAFLRKET
jgi:hypothetical protein